MQDNFNIYSWKLKRAITELEEKRCPDCGCKMEGQMCNECGYMEEGVTFTDKHDDNPKLKGGQKDLPDELQAQLIKKEVKVGDKVRFKTKDVSGKPLYGGKTLKVVSQDGKRWILKGNGFQTDATEKELELVNEDEDHEVSMAQASLKSIISSASQLISKLGDDERDIPGWIQDHITNAENYIDQANQGFHELEPAVKTIDTDVVAETVDKNTLGKVEQVLDMLSHLKSNTSTNSNIPTTDKQGLVYAFQEMEDVLEDVAADIEQEDEYVSDYARRRASELNEVSDNPEGDALVLRFLQGIAKKFEYPVSHSAMFVKERIKKLGY